MNLKKSKIERVKWIIAAVVIIALYVWSFSGIPLTKIQGSAGQVHDTY